MAIEKLNIVVHKGETIKSQTTNDITSKVDEIIDAVNNIETVVVVDVLDSSSAVDALSANQGRILSDRIEKLENAPTNDLDVKKQTLKLYKQMGDASPSLKPYTDELRSAMIGLNDFAKLGTGLFIHWGVYAVPAGNYTGKKQAGSTVTATSMTRNCEWIMRDLSIPVKTYKAYASSFTATKWDPVSICKAAAEAGMGYVVITAKHHDGFILYPSIYGDWDVTDSAARPTIIDELKAACDAYKLKFGLYISQYWDWTAEGGFGLNYGAKWNGSSADLYTADQHKEYMNRACLQINEMIEKFNPDILWYDPGTNYGDTYVNILRTAELNNWPHVITNDRLDYNRRYGDYGTGERTIYVRSLPVGEACFTMNNTWGYSDNNETDSWYYSHEKVMKEFMIYSLAYGQNCLMNIGPKADGSIPSRQLAMIQSFKDFIDKYGSFKNYKRYHYNFIPKFGYVIELDEHKLACYIATKGNPTLQDIDIDCVPLNNLGKVNILTPGADASYEIQPLNNIIKIHNLALDSDTKFGVVVLEYSKTITPLAGNIYFPDSEISSRVFVYNNGNMSYDITNLYYKLKPSNAVNHTTTFIWKGDTNNYTISLNRVLLQESPISTDDVTTVTISDGETSQVVTYAYNINESDTTVTLTKDTTYTLTVCCSGTVSSELYRFNGFTFNTQIIIIHPDSVTLDYHELYIAEGGSGLLEATVLPDNVTDPSITWSSADETIAAIDQEGHINAIKAGETTITVTTVDGGKTDTCHVIVTGQQIIHATDLTLSNTSIEKEIGQTKQLVQTVIPSNATYQQVTWVSTNNSIATVDNTGLVTIVGDGTATIKCTLDYDQIEATCAVTGLPIMPNSISLNKESLTLIPGYGEQLVVTFDPATTTHQEVNWTISDDTVATVVNGYVFALKAGNATITATSVSGSKTATCSLTINAETYDNIFEAESLSGASDQGTEWNIHLFGEELQSWTLFGYVFSSKNKNADGTTIQGDNNATLYQCVVNSSPWSGLRIDADNNNYPTATKPQSPLIPRLLAISDNYFNTITGEVTSGKPYIDVAAKKHPICFSRNGSEYKYSLDGIVWTTINGLAEAQLNRLANAILTIGYDYRRSGGQITTQKYRLLITDYPVCVAIKYESEYPFYTLYKKYYVED